MKTPDQYRTEAVEFCKTALDPLCSEILKWMETGVLGEAPFFRKLSEMCKLFAGVEYGRAAAENMVKLEAMRYVNANP